MKNAIIICSAGMSSSMIAQRVTKFFEDRDLSINVDATTLNDAKNIVEKDKYDLYLLSPQANMAEAKIRKVTDAHDKPLVNIESDAYLPTDESTVLLAKQIFPLFKEDLKKEKDKG